MGMLDNLRKADKARKEAQASAVAKPSFPPEFKEAYEAIDAHKRGMPCLSDELAKHFAAMTGVEIRGAVGGTGDLGVITLSKLADMIAIVGELNAPEEEEAVGEEVAGEASDETIGAADPEPESEPEPEPEIVEPASKISALSPDAPAPDPETASAGPEGKDPLKPNKKPKASKASKAKPEVAAAPEQPAPAQDSETKPESGFVLDGGFVLIVDGSTNKPSTAIDQWAIAIADAISAAAGQDLRTVKTEPLGFGGWKGVYCMDVEQAAGQLRGICTIRSTGSELLGLAVETLIKHASIVIWSNR